MIKNESILEKESMEDGELGGKPQVQEFNNVMGSFSSKSMGTVDESNQSVAQEFKTNESIAMQSYTIVNLK